VAAAPTPPAPPAPSAPLPVSPPRFNVAYLKNPLPPYPPMLRRAGQEGKVLLRVFVTTDGRAGEVKLEKTSGFPMFDESAMSTVKDWKFQPGKRGDAAEAQWVLVPINFTLN
jgi:protein TonB